MRSNCWYIFTKTKIGPMNRTSSSSSCTHEKRPNNIKRKNKNKCCWSIIRLVARFNFFFVFFSPETLACPSLFVSCLLERCAPVMSLAKRTTTTRKWNEKYINNNESRRHRRNVILHVTGLYLAMARSSDPVLFFFVFFFLSSYSFVKICIYFFFFGGGVCFLNLFFPLGVVLQAEGNRGRAPKNK